MLCHMYEHGHKARYISGSLIKCKISEFNNWFVRNIWTFNRGHFVMNVNQIYTHQCFCVLREYYQNIWHPSSVLGMGEVDFLQNIPNNVVRDLFVILRSVSAIMYHGLVKND